MTLAAPTGDEASPLGMCSVDALELEDPIVLAADATLRDVAVAMASAHVTAVLVRSDSDPLRSEGAGVAIVTEGDVIGALARGGVGDDAALDAATPDPVTVGPRTAALDAIELMTRLGIRHLPVTERGAVVGMLGLRAALRAALEGSHAVPWLTALRLALHVEYRGRAPSSTPKSEETI